MHLGRLKYDKSLSYCNKVYVGNWFEDRCHYIKHRHPIETTYREQYTPKPYSANDPSIVWDRVFDAEGIDPRVLTDHGGTRYLENFSTTYDLAYNHFPKYFGGPIYRHSRFRLERHEPDEPFLENFGNITNYGILEQKKEQWRCDKPDPRLTSTSLYQDTFLWHKIEPKVKKKSNKKNCNPITWECCPELVKDIVRCVSQE